MNRRTYSLFYLALIKLLKSPVAIVISVSNILILGFVFFFIHKFFIYGSGNQDIRCLFSSIPYLLSFSIPLYMYSQKSLIRDDFLPVSEINKTIALGSAVSLYSFANLCFLLVCVFMASLFCAVSVGQVISAYIGVVFLTMYYTFFSLLVYKIFSPGFILPLILQVSILLLLNLMYYISSYMASDTIQSRVFRFFSVNNHFIPFTYGLINTKNLFYFVLLTIVFALLTVFFTNKHLEKKNNRTTVILLTIILSSFLISFQRLYFQFDLSATKKYTVSSISKKYTQAIDENFTVTYWQSRQLSSYYPRTSEVIQFISDWSLTNKNIAFQIVKASETELKKKGFESQTIKNRSFTKDEYIDLYAVVELEYKGARVQLPFVISADTLEYDLCRAVESLTEHNQKTVYLVSGTDYKQDNHYQYFTQWLKGRGFNTVEVSKEQLEYLYSTVSKDDQIIIAGTQAFSQHEAALIEELILKGIKTIVFASPYKINIEDDWAVIKNKNDYLLKSLNNWGFYFENALIKDDDCLSLSLARQADSENATFVKYPFWLNIKNDNTVKQGVSFYWASPLLLYDGCKSVIQTSDNSYLEYEQLINGELYAVNPFVVEKLKKSSSQRHGNYTVQARKTGIFSGLYCTSFGEESDITVISNPLFIDSYMTGYAYSDRYSSFRNFDYICSILLMLRNKSDLAGLIEKNIDTPSLDKITNEKEFSKYYLVTLIMSFIVLPVFFIVFNGICIFVDSLKYRIKEPQ